MKMGSPAVRDFFVREALARDQVSLAPNLGFVYAGERIVAILLLLVLAPFGFLVGVAVFLLSRRSPLVRHLRVGWEGRPLPMLKFRTMWEPNPSGWRAKLIENVSDTIPVSKLASDPRVTSRFAAFCRKHSIDELPQLIHVATGEMSLVGPRPITRAELDDYYGDMSIETLSVRPGMTGLWQVMGRDRLTYAQRRRLDLWYVRRRSAGLYFRILARSIPAVLTD